MVRSWIDSLDLPVSVPCRFLPGHVTAASWNACGLSTDRAFALVRTATELSLDVILVQECHHPPAAALALLANMFHIQIATRPNYAAGGTMICWRRDRFSAPTTLASSDSSVEYVCGEALLLGSTRTVRLASVYAPPPSPTQPLAPAVFAEQVTSLVRTWNPHAIIGDFNARHLRWDARTPPVVTSATQRGSHLAQLSENLGLRVLAPQTPTCSRSAAGSVLDIALVAPSFGTCTASPSAHPLGGSDHHLVRFPLATLSAAEFAIPWTPHARVAWHKVDDRQRAAASEALSGLLLSSGLPNTSDAAHRLLVKSLRMVCSSFPQSLSGHHTSCSPVVRKALQAASHAWNAVQTATQCGYPDCVIRAIREWAEGANKRLDATVAAATSHSDAAYRSSAAWQLLRQLAPDNSPLPTQIGSWNTPRAQAAGFARLFAEKSAGGDPAPPPARAECAVPQITLAEVDAAINLLADRKAPDPDGVTAEALRLLAPPSREWLCRVFDLALRTRLPDSWRRSVVVPVLKQGKDPSEPRSYRPVALTSLFCRLLERIVLSRVLHGGCWLLSPEQFGFRAGSSAADAVAHMLTAASDAWNCSERGRQFRLLSAAIDFTDAFCRVRPSSFLREYAARGFDPTYAPFFRDFLSGRSFAVRVRDRLSDWHSLAIGAPQGSVLGPFLWAVVADRLIRTLSSRLRRLTCGDVGYATGPLFRQEEYVGCAFYADDGVIWATGSNENRLANALQSVLPVISEFATEEGIELSTKSSAMLFARRPKPSALSLTCGSLVLPVATSGEEKFLGVVLDPQLSLEAHVATCLSRGEERLAKVASIRRMLSPATARELIFGTCLSLVEYCLPAFGAHLSETVWARLEAFVLRCARCIVGAVASAPSSAVLAEAGLLPLRVVFQTRAALLCERIRRRPATCPLRRRLLATAVATVAWQPATHLRQFRAGEMDSVAPSALLPLRSSAAMSPELLARTPRVTILADAPEGLRVTAPVERRRSAVEKRVAGVQADTVCYCDASVEEATETSPLRSAGAFSIAGSVSSQAFGRYACSFTAEARTLLTLLHALEALPPQRIAIFADCLSVISSLARGPAAAGDAVIMDLWAELLHLAGHHLNITVAFIFGHVDFAPHDVVDLAAGAALRDAPAERIWWRDGARPHNRAIYAAYVASRKQSWWRDHNALSATNRCPRLPAAAAKVLLRLRTGVEPHVGGWRHGVNDPCPQCGAFLERSTAPGVAHFFSCTAAVAMRAEHGVTGPTDLWSPERYANILAYHRQFVNHSA